MEDIVKRIGKFWFPALCIIAGFALLKMGWTNEDERLRQNAMALAGTVAIIVIGIFSLLYILDIIKRPIGVVLSILFAIGAVYFGYQNYNTIDSELKYVKAKELDYKMTVQKLKDIRTAQIAFKDQTGRFTKDWGELKQFIMGGKIPTIKKFGSLPDSVTTEAQALELGLIQSRPAGMSDEEIIAQGLLVRDTVYENAKAVLFENEKAMSKRLFPLDIEKLQYTPGDGNVEFLLNAGFVDVSGGIKKPVFLVEDPEPFHKDDEALKVGSMTEVKTNGNWKE